MCAVTVAIINQESERCASAVAVLRLKSTSATIFTPTFHIPTLLIVIAVALKELKNNLSATSTPNLINKFNAKLRKLRDNNLSQLS